MRFAVVVAALLVSFSGLNAQPGKDDLKKTTAQEILNIRAQRAKDRTNNVLYVSEFSRQFSTSIRSMVIHKGWDVDRRFSNSAWIVITFKDGSQMMMVVTPGLLEVNNIVTAGNGRRIQVNGLTPVPTDKGTITPLTRRVNAYSIANPAAVLTRLSNSHYRLNMGTVSGSSTLVTGGLEYVPNVRHTPGGNFRNRIQQVPGGTTTPQVPRTHGNQNKGFIDRIRNQGQLPRTRQPRVTPRTNPPRR